MYHRPWFRVLAVAIGVVSQPTLAFGQVDQETCERSAALIRTNAGTSSEFGQRLWRMSQCRAEVQGAILQLWSSPPEDTERLRELTFHSRRAHGPGVVEVLLQVASSPSRGRTVRLSTLTALAGHVGACLIATIDSAVSPQGSPRAVTQVGVINADLANGSRPPAANWPRIRDGLADIVRTSADSSVAMAARTMVWGLNAMRESPGSSCD